MFEYMATLDKMLEGVELPRILPVEQRHFDRYEEKPESVLRDKLEAGFRDDYRGRTIAITCGSRGIDGYTRLLRVMVAFFRERGARPILIPAMGSHAGATAEGQTEMLRHFGVTEETIGAPVCASMDVVQVGTTERGMPVYADAIAARADGILLFNRIKPHTSFRGRYESGLIKMLVIGLGKQKGAAMTHFLRYENMARNLEEAAHAAFDALPVLGGVGTVENGYGRLAEVNVLTRDELFKEEPLILKRAFDYMPRIYLDTIDVLIVGGIGKDISGTGMDTNIIGRYHTNCASGGPKVTKMGVLALTSRAGGNANGIGLADFTTRRLMEQTDLEAMYVNTMTSGEPNSSRLPMALSCDRSVFRACVRQSGIQRTEDIRLVIIEDTKHIDRIYMSEAALRENCGAGNVKAVGEPFEIPFDAEGNLLGLFQ